MDLVAALLAATCLCACSRDTAPDATRPAATETPASAASVVQHALAGTGLHVIGTLEAPAGYHGFIARYRNHEVPVYALPGGRHLVLGTLLDLHGNDLTSPALDRGFGGISIDEAQWHALEAAAWFASGSGDAPRVVYAFVDSRCPFCRQLWEESRPWRDAGAIQLRGIPVAVLTPQSLPEAAEALAAPDPEAAWARIERRPGNAQRATPVVPPASAIAKVRANGRLMASLGFNGTPGIVWRDPQGRIHALQGVPTDARDLAVIFGRLDSGSEATPAGGGNRDAGAAGAR
ncbi:MAG TPA: thiol:disulfide interchange protein DsbG [Nevskiaceae bacterium]